MSSHRRGRSDPSEELDAELRALALRRIQRAAARARGEPEDGFAPRLPEEWLNPEDIALQDEPYPEPFAEPDSDRRITARGIAPVPGMADLGRVRLARQPDDGRDGYGYGGGVRRDRNSDWDDDEPDLDLDPDSDPDGVDRSDFEPGAGNGGRRREVRQGGWRDRIAAVGLPVPRGDGIGLGRRGALVLVVIAVVAAGIAGVTALRSRPQVQPIALSSGAESVPTPAATTGGGASNGTSGAGATPSGGSASPVALVVAVQGKVRHPGVVHLSSGARVINAIDAAGGALPSANLTGLNLARPVADGELILVGVPMPSNLAPTAGTAAGGGAAGGDAGAPEGSAGAAGGASTAAGKVSLNTATVQQLADGLPGVGPVLAQNIVTYRQAHGGFTAISQLQQVDGIGDKRYSQLSPLCTL